MRITIIDPRRYLFFKIFLWFWLTLVATVSLLFFLSNITLGDVNAEPLKGTKLKNLQQIAKNIEHVANKKNRSLTKVVQHPRLTRHRTLYFAATDPELSFFNRNTLPDIDVNLLSFSQNLAPQAILTKQYHAFGPIKITIAKQNYWLYEIEPNIRHNFALKLKIMPLWLKLCVAIMASLSLSLLFSRSLIKPINSLKNAAFLLASGKLKTRIQSNSNQNDELGQLTNDFNKMAENLELLMTSQKRLLADISHELRSPLTRLQMAAGLAQIHQNDQTGQYLVRIEKEAKTLDDMISDVLKLSRLEAQSQMLSKEYQPFSLVLNPVLSDATFEAKQNNKRLNIVGEQDAEFKYDGQIISSALDNVLRNAIKYANSLITVELKHNKNHLIITISDDGPGVPNNDLKQLFEPFFRVSHSRERNSGGTGLGLAITKHAILAHNGIIELKNQDNSGLSVIISLPI
ncbi:ATP-binding protein [Pseudoalteromonas denitrificans]|uniref:histidine kinase n=1 Tax=Pseudoalteromonas denitrificans DSM 6059 TaxID=1123010 RepID=A0A1I1P6Y2_9GAMM|nr:ATP-binding protein [Pseudoalteromonas denitrificans]SFD02753.1 two-component system, OmpR family, sensor histidine kinase CpxA [Pseudoalteromonas denitrificans DSM 6059]